MRLRTALMVVAVVGYGQAAGGQAVPADANGVVQRLGCGGPWYIVAVGAQRCWIHRFLLGW